LIIADGASADSLDELHLAAWAEALLLTIISGVGVTVSFLTEALAVILRTTNRAAIAWIIAYAKVLIAVLAVTTARAWAERRLNRRPVACAAYTGVAGSAICVRITWPLPTAYDYG
jgi:hypothetical protein